ncbi:MAG: creatininase family protein [Paracoccaceae bacterium]
MTRRFDWAEYRAPEFAQIDAARTIAILPTAAIEQHGPHLPVGVDMMIAEAMLARLRADCPAGLDIRILPVQAVGKSNEHLWAAGTLTMGWEAALQSWIEIGLSVARAGVRKIVIINSHGGNLDLISILSRELRVQAGMIAIKAQWASFGAPEGLFSAQEDRFGIHGGDAETSVMLAHRPDLVDMSLAQDFRSRAETAPIPPTGPVSLGWVSRDLNPAGVVGEAHLATAEKGHALLGHCTRGMIDLLTQVRDLSLDGYAPVKA